MVDCYVWDYVCHSLSVVRKVGLREISLSQMKLALKHPNENFVDILHILQRFAKIAGHSRSASAPFGFAAAPYEIAPRLLDDSHKSWRNDRLVCYNLRLSQLFSAIID